MRTLVVPIWTISEANQRGITRLAAILKAKRIKQQRSETYLTLRAAWVVPPLAPYTEYGPVSITLVRIAPRELDQGNIEASFKAVQDGVADWLAGEYRKGKDRQPGLYWRYGQRHGRPREHAVEITVLTEEIAP